MQKLYTLYMFLGRRSLGEGGYTAKTSFEFNSKGKRP